MKNTYKLADNHCHTEFAYCATDITIDTAVTKAKEKGLEYISFTEHAGHLYFDSKNCWNSLTNPSFMTPSNFSSRISEYISSLKKHSPFVKIGFEVDADKSGNLNLMPEDRLKADLLVGGVHLLYKSKEFATYTTLEADKHFIVANESLCIGGITVVAPPFRIFCNYGMKMPLHLYKSLINMLKSYNVAAELNFHSRNIPDPVFFELCLEEGIKISLGSDSHSSIEVGEFEKHKKFLEKIGVTEKEYKEVLFKLKPEVNERE